MSIKYKIDDAKKNKNLINDEIKLSRIKSHSGPTTKPRRAKAPGWFIEFEKRNNQRLDRIESNVLDLRNDLNRVIKLNNLEH